MKAVYILVFIGGLFTGAAGFWMYRDPQAWAKGNAWLSRKDIHVFDSAKQLAATRQRGVLFMAIAAFELLSLLFLIAFLSRFPLK